MLIDLAIWLFYCTAVATVLVLVGAPTWVAVLVGICLIMWVERA